MFNSTVTLKAITGETVVNLIDGPTNQRTVRSAVDSKDGVLSVAHQSSNENPGFDTQRSNVRFLTSKEVGDTGKFVSGYVQFTMSLPRDTYSAADAQVMAAKLFNFLIQGESPDGSEADTSVSHANCAAIARLYAGEP
jgi:hypothetical protein